MPIRVSPRVLTWSYSVGNGDFVHMKHFDSKAEVEEYVRELGIPATFFYAGTYMSNFVGALQKVFPAAFFACWSI